VWEFKSGRNSLAYTNQAEVSVVSDDQIARELTTETLRFSGVSECPMVPNLAN
jgi:hypothetical protein